MDMESLLMKDIVKLKERFEKLTLEAKRDVKEARLNNDIVGASRMEKIASTYKIFVFNLEELIDNYPELVPEVSETNDTNKIIYRVEYRLFDKEFEEYSPIKYQLVSIKPDDESDITKQIVSKMRKNYNNNSTSVQVISSERTLI
jgi:hypothetical protein